MKNHKCNLFCKLMALALALLLVAGLIPATALAAPATRIIVDQGYAMPGQTVELDVVLTDNTGISNALLEVYYDDSLELIAAERGDALTYLFFTKPAVFSSPANFLWDSLAGEDAEDGTLLHLTFKVKEGAQTGRNARVWLDCYRGDISDANDQPVNVTFVEGFVEIIDYMPGDVNSDTLINGTDVSILRRYIVGDPVEIHALAGDVNGDSRLNGTDVVLLRRYIAGGYDVELKTGRAACAHPSLSAVEAQEASCSKAGNIAYWVCGNCNRYFADAKAKYEVEMADIVIDGLEHTVVVDQAVAPTYDAPGLTEGSHCSECNEVIVAQQPIAQLQANYHAITYMELHGAESPQPDRYAEHEGLLDLPVPERPGYEFKGWYTSTDGGDVVDYIPKGSTKNYILFAVWEKETYDIIYFEAPENNNVDSYTVDDIIELEEPRWSGLVFTHWTDQYGNIVTEIPKGSSGDLELTAHWKRLRNIASPGNSKGLLMTYDPETERYFFIYELGVIEHVVLEEVSVGSANLKYNSGATDITFTLENSVTVSDTVADTIATTVGKSISDSTEWERSTEWGGEESNAHNVSVGVSAEFGMGPVTAKIETEYGYTSTQTESWGKSESYGGSEEVGNETSYTTSSTVSYMKEINSTVTTSFTISKDMPEGYYSYVHAGNVRVFGIVTYDPHADTFYLDTYSIVDNMHETMLYYRDVNELNDQSTEPLDYNIPRDRILDIVDNSYFIQYLGNGNDGGQMPMTVQNCEETVILINNQFTKTGYTFQEWLAEDGETHYRDGSQITGLGELGEVITLSALWGKNNYTIHYNDNKPAKASSDVVGMPENTKCVYDEPVTLGAAPTLTGWTFGGWYTDEACTQPLGDGGEYFEKANFADEANVTLEAYAKWVSNDIQVTLDANLGYTDSEWPQVLTMSYNDVYGTLPTPTRNEHVFMGWYLGDQRINPFTQIVTETDHTLTAKWLRTELSWSWQCFDGYWNPDEYEYPDGRKTVTDSDGVYELISFSFNKEELLAYGYKEIEVKVTFDACEYDDGYVEVWTCNSNKGRFEGSLQQYDIPNIHDYKQLTYTYVVPIEELDEFCNIYIEFGASGKNSDTWVLGWTGTYVRARK